MGKDITLGQYYPVESWIHKLDPRVKLAATFLYVISLFVFRGIVGFILATAFLVLVIAVSKIPVRYIIKGVRAIFVLCAITAFFNLFFTAGETLVSVGKITITYEGLRLAVYMAIRLIYLVMGTSIMTLATTPGQLTAGIEKGCAFLNRFRVPVHEVAMMMSIALRFVPILMEETDKIKKAQMARGADFESGNLIKRAKSLIPILVPLFVSAFRRANELALAMESRCYHGGEGRTKLRPLKYARRDAAAYVIAIAYLVIMIVVRARGL